MDLFVQGEDQPATVVRFDGDRVKTVDPDGKVSFVKRTNGFNFQRTPKVSSTLVQLEGLEAEAVFSPHNDPQRDWLKTRANLTGSLVDQATTAQASQMASEQNTFYAQQAAGNAFNSEAAGAAQDANSIQMQASGAMDDAMYQLQTTFDSSPLQQAAYKKESEGNFDAVELRFSVSSPEPIADAQVVALITIRSEYRQLELNFHRNIGTIGPKPRKITLMQANLPEGFEVMDHAIHVFSGREEVATTLSSNLTQLSRDFASKFAQLDYIEHHREANAPASPIWSLAPSELRATQNLNELDHPVTVDLDAEGNLVAIQGSTSPSNVESIVSKMAFLPALESGKPVASRLEVNPADYFR